VRTLDLLTPGGAAILAALAFLADFLLRRD
jgi:hypothetical protein